MFLLSGYFFLLYFHAQYSSSPQSLLDEPNPNSPANSQAAQLYQENKREYEKRVSAIVEQSCRDGWPYDPVCLLLSCVLHFSRAPLNFSIPHHLFDFKLSCTLPPASLHRIFFCPPRGIYFCIQSPFSSPSRELCWILPWCFVTMDFVPKIFCVLTCCNTFPWIIMLNVLNIKSWVLFYCAPSSLLSVCFHKAVCLGSSVIILSVLGRRSNLNIMDYSEVRHLYTEMCCELCYMHGRKSVFTFLFSTRVYKNPATEFMYRFCTGCSACHFFSSCK